MAKHNVQAGLLWIAGQGLRLSVADDGQGLPADFALERSPGLGTRIMLALAERLGGQIQARSREGGAEFALVLPDPAAPTTH